MPYQPRHQWFREAFASIAEHNVTVPAGALRVWEDGEIFTDTSQTSVYKGLEADPLMLAEYRSVNISNVTGGGGRPASVYDWRSYSSGIYS